MEIEKKGLLILGYDYKEVNWEQTVWGTPSQKAGRLVRGVAIILEENIDLAIISSGGWWREGRSEAKAMKERLYNGLEELREFTVYPVLQKFSSEKIREKLDDVIVLEERSQNTAESMALTGQIFREYGITKVIVTTSPDHISRAILNALIYWGDFPELAANVWATPSITLYSARTSEDISTATLSNVIIVEPAVIQRFKLTKIFKILKDSTALSKLNNLLKKYEARKK